MRLSLAAACVALLALSGCAAADGSPAIEAEPSPSIGVQLEGSYEPLTSGPVEPTPDGPRGAGAAAPSLVATGDAGHTALLQAEALGPTTDVAVGVLRVEDGCLEVALEADPTRYGAVLVGGVGHSADQLVIDGAVLPFDERLELPWADIAPMHEAPAEYRSACPGVVSLFGIGP
ncbi:MAG: hypothetical protein ACQEWM_09880 [Actinomycetota bacterium]